MGIQVLGPVSPFRGGQVAELGSWIVVFQHNRPVSLYSPGMRVRRLFQAPVIGVGVASLDTRPQDLSIPVADVLTIDNYRLPTVTVDLQLRLAPELANAGEALLSRISRDGDRFFDSVEAELRQAVEARVRRVIKSASADSILDQGPAKVVFPDGRLSFNCPFVEITSVSGVRWEESTFRSQVLQTFEREVAARAEESLLAEARERDARVTAHKARLEAEQQLREQEAHARLEAANLASTLDRARALGVDPLSIAEPDVWRQVNERQSDLLAKLLEAQHLYPIVRSSPDLMRAIVHQISGGGRGIAMAREADMVLDGLYPGRVRAIDAGTIVHSQADSSEFMRHAGLAVDPRVRSAWIACGGPDELTGSGFALPYGSTTGLLVVAGKTRPNIPSSFDRAAAEVLRSLDARLDDLRIEPFAATALDEAIEKAVLRISGKVRTSAALRQVGDAREVFVELHGDHDEVVEVYRRMTDPSIPILPALENLVGDKVRIRFALPAA